MYSKIKRKKKQKKKKKTINKFKKEFTIQTKILTPRINTYVDILKIFSFMIRYLTRVDKRLIYLIHSYYKWL